MRIRSVFLAMFFLISCEKRDTLATNEIDCSSKVLGEMIGSDPVGIWKYYDDRSNVLLKIDYQTELLGSYRIQNFRKYFSLDGRLIQIEGYLDGQSAGFHSQDSSNLEYDVIGKILVEEYCYSCHRMNTRLVAKELHGYTFLDASLTEILHDHNHALRAGDFIWENKENLLFLSAQQMNAIRDYITQ